MSRPQDLSKFDVNFTFRMQKKLLNRLKKLKNRKVFRENLENFSLSDYCRGVLASHFRIYDLQMEEILLEKRIEKQKKVLEKLKLQKNKVEKQ